jgi:hypothetical protein
VSIDWLLTAFAGVVWYGLVWGGQIVVPDEAPSDPVAEAEADWLRTIQVSGNKALVHWWYYPDSYDTWIPKTEVQGEAEKEEEHVGAWTVVC